MSQMRADHLIGMLQNEAKTDPLDTDIASFFQPDLSILTVLFRGQWGPPPGAGGVGCGGGCLGGVWGGVGVGGGGGWGGGW